MIAKLFEGKHVIIFDLDGTLFDSNMCFQAIRSELGLASDAPLIEHIETLDASQKAHFTKAICEIEQQNAEQGSLYPEVPSLLNALSKHPSELAIWTRNSSRATAIALGEFQRYFAQIITREDAKAKPHPQGLHDILAAKQCDYRDALFIGDSEYDVFAAREVGIPTVIINSALANTFDGDEHIHPLSSLSELLTIVKR